MNSIMLLLGMYTQFFTTGIITHIHIHIHVYITHIHLYTDVHIYIYICIHVCAYLFNALSVVLCYRLVCMFNSLQQVSSHIYIQMYVFTYMCMYTGICLSIRLMH